MYEPDLKLEYNGKEMKKPRVVMHAYNPSILEAETGELRVPGQPRQKISETPISKMHLPSQLEIVVQAILSKK
jgi:hypothetical protein